MNSSIVSKLGENLDGEFAQSRFIKVAVALVSDYAKFTELISKSNAESIELVIGYYLPTDPKVFKWLLRNAESNNVIAKVLHGGSKRNFHPKVYMFSDDGKRWRSYVGSGNWTKGGWSNNIEMNIKIESNNTSEDLLEWFEEINDSATLLNYSFYDRYKEQFESMQATRSNLKKLEDRNAKIEGLQSRYGDRKDFINVLKKGASQLNKDIKTSRRNEVKEILRVLDYDNDFSEMDFKAFLKLPTLGNLRPLFMFKMDDDIEILRNSIKELDSSEVKIGERIDSVISRPSGLGKNIITKLLSIFNDGQYFVWNGVSESVLRNFNLLRSSTFDGDNYVSMNKLMDTCRQEAGIADFFVFDQVIYDIFHGDVKLGFTYHRYWSQYLIYQFQNPNQFSGSPTKQHAICIKSKGNRGITLNVNREGGYIYVGLDFTDTIAYNNFRNSNQASLEELFKGSDIEWNPHESKKQCIIQIKKSIAEIESRHTWNSQFKWFYETALRLFNNYFLIV